MDEDVATILSKPYHSPFHAYCIKPNVSFEEQVDGEEVLIQTRPHPITQVPWLVNSLILFGLLLVSNIFTMQYLSTAQIIFGNLFGLGFIFAYVWFNFIMWYFDVGLVTNLRVVDIDFPSILIREISATQVDKIEEATARIIGAASSIFNFGDVYVQTAGSEQNIEFLRVPYPSRIVKIINNLTNKKKHGS